MFRISPSLKERVKEKAEENDCTMTNYIEYLIQCDLENDKPNKTKRHKLT